MIVANRSKTSTPKQILERLRRDYFPKSRFSEAQAGVTVAHDHRRELASAFQPVMRATDGAICGHQALLRGIDEHGRSLMPNELFSGPADEAVEELDRLARALHAVNFFANAHDSSRLFMTIDPRVVAQAPEDHRRYFDSLLSLLDVPTSRIVIVLRSDALDDPVNFVRSTISYGIRGYRVLAGLRLADAHADLDHVFLADPHYVAIDSADFSSPGGNDARHDRLRSTVSSLRSRGIQAVARRVETEAQAQAARDAGFSLLQGWHVGRTSPRPANA